MGTEESTSQNTHYKAASDAYHSAFFYTGQYESWQLDTIMEKLNLQKTDRLVDLGGGTGRFASLTYKEAGLEHPVMCVDPSPDMLNQAKRCEGVQILCNGAKEFAQTNDVIYDRVLLKEVVHHLSENDLKIMFKSLLKTLSSNGKILICTRPHEVEYPFFQGAHDVWKRNQPPSSYYVSLLQNEGYHVTSSESVYPASIDINWWVKMIRNRFWSTFSEFDEEKLEKGIEEIFQKYGRSGDVNFSEKLILIVAQKN